MFRIEERGSAVSTELLAGLSTFLTVVYILVLVPGMLGNAGIPVPQMITMIVVSSAICAFIMGFGANLPFVVIPGVGMCAFSTSSAVLIDYSNRC